jgi:ERF superfamily
MPPRTRKSESDVADQPVTDVDAPDESVHQPGPAAMFSEAIKVVEQRMSTRMDSIATQQGERNEQVNLSLDAVTRKLSEVALGQQAVSEIMATLEERINALPAEQAPTQGDEWGAENNGRLAEVETSVVSLATLVEQISDQLVGLHNQLTIGRDEQPTDPSGDFERHMLRHSGTETGRHILSAIWAVMCQVEGVGKHGAYRDGGQVKYKFRAFDDVADAIGKAFRDQGVMMQSKVLDKQVERAMVGTKYWTACSITIEYVFTSLVDGSTVSFEAVGEGRDLSDKAHGKAMTMAAKSALGQAFMLAVGDEDPDSTRPGDDSATGEVQPQVRVPANETPAARAAREQFEARRAAKPEPVDHMADAQRQLEQQLGAREVARNSDGIPMTTPVGDDAPDAEPWDGDGDGSSVHAPADARGGDAAAAMERAQMALNAARATGVDFNKLNRIIGQASNEGILQVVLEGTSLQSHLIAISRTVL